MKTKFQSLGLNALFILLAHSACAQTTDKLHVKEEPVFDTSITPEILLGTFVENPRTTKFTIDPQDAKLTLSGRILGKEDSPAILGVNLAANSENDIADLFSGTKITPKVEFGLVGAVKLRNWVSYDAALATTGFEKMTYEELLYNKDNRNKLKRVNGISLILGLNTDAAKYYLIDTTASFDDMVVKNKYSGWEFFVQPTMLTYSIQSDWLWFHSVRLGYGESNNVDDLDEYDITNSFTYTSAQKKDVYERKRTGYFNGDYKVEHQGTIAWESGFYPTPEGRGKAGLLIGSEFTYHQYADNELNAHMGVTFLVSRKDGEDKEEKVVLFYISAIVQNDFNIMKAEDVKFKDGLSAFIRISRPLEWKSNTSKRYV